MSDHNENSEIFNDIENEAGEAGSIQAIGKGDVHRICSGQVVLNLATAVKELVENSLDAGATHVEVRLKEYGSELLEVVDNGAGVEDSNFAGLTLKHHTSKLREFSDLVGVDTFGFRGEALSSLCALSNLKVVTCHKNASVGTRLEYDHNGKIKDQAPVARQQGTTVSLGQLFYTLPVRHKEFLRNLKKEYARMVQVLNAYCLISTGVRITCTNQMAKGKKSIVVNTNGNETLKENITNIFGVKQMQSLLPFCQKSPSEEVCNEYSFQVPDGHTDKFRISGFVSTSKHGQGRSSTDRQFYFVNKRPCDPPKISRVVNEVYHMYNRHQNPFVLLNISLQKENVDVNVTPDKRQIFMQEERLLLATIKSSLIAMFDPVSSTYQVNNPKAEGSIVSAFARSESSPAALEMSGLQKTDVVLPKKQKSLTSTLSSMKRSFGSAFAKDSTAVAEDQDSPKHRRLDYYIKSEASVDASSSDTAANSMDSPTLRKTSSDSCSAAAVMMSPDSCMASSLTSSQESTASDRILHSPFSESPDIRECKETDVTTTTNTYHKSPVKEDSIKAGGSETNVGKPDVDSTHILQNSTDKLLHVMTESPQRTKSVCDSPSEGRRSSNVLQLENRISALLSRKSSPKVGKSIKTESEDCAATSLGTSKLMEYKSAERTFVALHKIECDGNDGVAGTSNEDIARSSKPASDTADILCIEDEDPEDRDSSATYDTATDHDRHRVVVPFSISAIKNRLKQKAEDSNKEAISGRGFHARINPGDNQAAEDELQREISKDMFPKMEILGQFNLGFIIARLDQDLFIIDQHATDEKYNFEDLQKNTTLKCQKLIQPQNLELTAVNEGILIDNIEIFQKNGFEFLIDEQGQPTQRVKLTAMPVSQNWTFGKSDIEELIFMLQDSPGILCRPSRVRAMFASRACRKSIMIGTALNKAEMKKLVSHMGELEQPWNCPHGRPTMRHLINLNALAD